MIRGQGLPAFDRPTVVAAGYRQLLYQAQMSGTLASGMDPVYFAGFVATGIRRTIFRND